MRNASQPIRVLLTGGSGFIGSYVLRHLVGRVGQIRVLALPETVDRVPCRDAIEIVEGSLTDPLDLRRAVRGVDVVTHVGGCVLGSPQKDLVAVNITGTGHLLKAAAQASVRRFVYVSSAAVYDRTHFLPRVWPIDESFPLAAHGVPALKQYGESKMEAERLVRTYEGEGREHVIVRPTVTYGRGAGFIERLLDNLLRYPGSVAAPSAAVASLQWIHARDVASIVGAATSTRLAASTTFTAAGPELFSMRTVAEIAEALRSGDEQAVMHAGARIITGRVRYSVEQARRLLAWSPRMSLVDGLREMVNAPRRAQVVAGPGSAMVGR